MAHWSREPGGLKPRRSTGSSAAWFLWSGARFGRRALAKGAHYTIEARWAKVARAALDTFRLMRAIAESTDNAVLAAHVQVLSRHLGRKTGRKPKKTKG